MPNGDTVLQLQLYLNICHQPVLQLSILQSQKKKHYQNNTVFQELFSPSTQLQAAIGCVFNVIDLASINATYLIRSSCALQTSYI